MLRLPAALVGGFFIGALRAFARLAQCRVMTRIIIAFAIACLCAQPASAFFQGPWNVHAQRGNIFKSYGKGGGEASLSPKLRGVISHLRRAYGPSAVRNVGGRGGRPGPSCHPSGNAFDAHLSAAARRYVMGRRDLGVITYSGRMSHVHVSDCARERGDRGHKAS